MPPVGCDSPLQIVMAVPVGCDSPLQIVMAVPVGCDSPLQIVMAVWRPFFEFGCSQRGCDSPLQIVMAVWRPSNKKKRAPNSHYYLQRAVTPNQITQQNSLQRAGAPSRQKRHFKA